ncbi:Transketolase-like protein 2 [Polyplax serrata]|uniref:transketolase n=1 Tax=Polyplax serrata TaxID=468196 RepID=A0ABR1BGB1_POLSC
MNNKPNIQALQDIANRLRIHSVAATNASKSGHPTSCSSLAEIMSVLFFNVMRYNTEEPRHRSSDRFVLSKGHAAPILYAAWAEAGLFSPKELLQLRKLDSDLEGHPTPRLNFIDVATGSLGQGLSIACGMAYVGKYFDRSSYRVYCVVGDGESCEGSIWEALHFAGYYKLHNLCVIFDINRLGQSGPTSMEHNMESYKNRLEAFGFRADVVNGHSIEALCVAFHSAAQYTEKPTAILAQTYKGKDFPEIENSDNWHGKPLMDRGDVIMRDLHSTMKTPEGSKIKPLDFIDDTPEVDVTNIELATPPNYKLGESVATRFAYGVGLSKIAANNDRVVALDADTKNSTFSDKLKNAFPERHIECYIAEQNLAGVAVGAACRDRTVAFASTFAAFLTRAFDQIRMAAISQSNVNFVGSHCGVSIGEDGPSQMGLEDIAMFRSVPSCTVFYPSDAVSAERAVEIAANTKGICYIRTSRPATNVLYRNDEHFEIGRAKVLRKSVRDRVLIIAAGVTLHEALIAADKLAGTVAVRIIDPFTVKPLDSEAIKLHAKECGGNIVVVEDHYPEGGLGEAVMSALAEERGVCIKHLAVREVPKSGPPSALLDKYGISSNAIVAAIGTF